MKKLTSDKKCYLILGIFNAVALVALISVGAVFNEYWGLTTGWALGCITTFINMVLLFKSGRVVEQSAKSEKGIGLSVGFYFIRFLLIAGMFVVCALMQWKFEIPAFKYSLFTCAASVLPSALIILIFYRADIDEDNKKIETK